MVTWLAIKTFFKKAWVWLKHNWKVPLIIIYTLVLWLLFRQKDAAYKVLEVRNESYKAQIDVINNAHEEEIRKRNEILEKYNETIREVEKEFILKFKRKNQKVNRKTKT